VATIRDLLAGLGSVVRGGQDLINRNLPQNTDLFNNALEGLTGRGYDELSTQGQAAYPNTPIGSAHHQLASKLATEALLDKIGWVPGVGPLAAQALPQVAGLGVEGLEAVGRMTGGVPGAGVVEHFTMPDTLADIIANAQGSREALDEYQTRSRPSFKGGKF
jgi:hypothetical protein